MIARLRSDGHVVDAISEQSPGLDDRSVLAQAVHYDILLLTRDRDFGDLIYRDRVPAPAAGVVLYRIPNTYTEDQVAAIVAAVFAQHTSDRLAHWLTIIEPSQVRQRPLP